MARTETPDNTPHAFATEIWLNESMLPALEYSDYWNNEEIEKLKPLYVLNGDFSGIDAHLADSRIVQQFKYCADLMEKELKKPFHGVGADIASGNLWAVPLLAAMPAVD